MSVIGIKLVTGEEVIGRAQQTQTGQVKLSTPVQIKLLPSQVPGAPPSLGFAPWPEYAIEGSPILLEPLHIVYQYTPDVGIATEYENMQNQGQTTTNQIITG